MNMGLEDIFDDKVLKDLFNLVRMEEFQLPCPIIKEELTESGLKFYTLSLSVLSDFEKYNERFVERVFNLYAQLNNSNEVCLHADYLSGRTRSTIFFISEEGGMEIRAY